MGEVIRFAPRSELKRARLIREGRSKYHSNSPLANTVNEQQGRTSISRAVRGTDYSDGILPS
jgi:hypothetical protein